MSPGADVKLRRNTPEALQVRNLEPTDDVEVLRERLEEDPRFNLPAPSIWKRVALIVFVFFIFWFAINMRMRQSKPQVIHAQRYSSEYKFRPAASPIITERLKDGRTRLRGAAPTVRV